MASLSSVVGGWSEPGERDLVSLGAERRGLCLDRLDLGGGLRDVGLVLDGAEVDLDVERGAHHGGLAEDGADAGVGDRPRVADAGGDLGEAADCSCLLYT